MKSIFQTLARGHWPSLLGAWLHFEVSFMVWLLIGALGVSISSQFGLTATEKGLLVAVPILGGALFRLPIGLFSDCLGPKRVGIAVLMAELLVLLWGWLGAQSYPDMLGVGLGLGIAGASFAVALPVASGAYPLAHQGLAMGVAASANSGIVLAVFLAPRLAQSFGWHNVFGLMLLPVAGTLIAFAFLVRPDLKQTHPSRPGTASLPLLELLRHPTLYRLCLMYVVTFGGFVGLCSFLPLFLHDQYGLNLVEAGSVAACCGLAGSLVRPVGGSLADRLDARKLLTAVFLGLAVLSLLLSRLYPLSVMGALLVVSVTLMGSGNGVVFRLVSESFHERMGVASGIVGAAGALGGFLFPSWMGLLKDLVGTYEAGYLLFGGVAGLAAVNLIMARNESKSARSEVAAHGVLH